MLQGSSVEGASRGLPGEEVERIFKAAIERASREKSGLVQRILQFGLYLWLLLNCIQKPSVGLTRVR